MLAVLPDPTTAVEAHARIQAIRSRQFANANRGPLRDWLYLASPEADPITQTAREIVQRVAESFGVTVADIKGERRGAHIVAARKAAYHAVAVAHPGWSFARIGRVFGRDHSTILELIRKMERDGVPQPPARLKAGGV